MQAGRYPQGMADKLTQPLLDSSFAYVRAKRTFETSITAARSAGWSDEQIAVATGLTVAMIEAVAGVGREQRPVG